MKKTPILFLFAALSAVGLAEPVVLTRSETYELHEALTRLAPGLTPDNTFIAADDINVLTADANAYRQAFAKLVQLQQSVNATPTPESVAKFKIEDARLTALSEEKRTYDLKNFELTKDEVKAANVTALTLSVIRRLLKPQPSSNNATPPIQGRTS